MTSITNSINLVPTKLQTTQDDSANEEVYQIGFNYDLLYTKFKNAGNYQYYVDKCQTIKIPGTEVNYLFTKQGE